MILSGVIIATIIYAWYYKLNREEWSFLNIFQLLLEFSVSNRISKFGLEKKWEADYKIFEADTNSIESNFSNQDDPLNWVLIGIQIT